MISLPKDFDQWIEFFKSSPLPVYKSVKKRGHGGFVKSSHEKEIKYRNGGKKH